MSIREKFDSLNYGLTIVEILDKLLQENDADPIIFRLSIRTLLALKSTQINYDIVFFFFSLAVVYPFRIYA